MKSTVCVTCEFVRGSIAELLVGCIAEGSIRRAYRTALNGPDFYTYFANEVTEGIGTEVDREQAKLLFYMTFLRVNPEGFAKAVFNGELSDGEAYKVWADRLIDVERGRQLKSIFKELDIQFKIKSAEELARVSVVRHFEIKSFESSAWVSNKASDISRVSEILSEAWKDAVRSVADRPYNWITRPVVHITGFKEEE